MSNRRKLGSVATQKAETSTITADDAVDNSLLGQLYNGGIELSNSDIEAIKKTRKGLGDKVVNITSIAVGNYVCQLAQEGKTVFRKTRSGNAIILVDCEFFPVDEDGKELEGVDSFVAQLACVRDIHLEWILSDMEVNVKSSIPEGQQYPRAEITTKVAA